MMNHRITRRGLLAGSAALVVAHEAIAGTITPQIGGRIGPGISDGGALGNSGASRQPTYYFSAAGNDGNDGRTISTPKQTITAFNGLTLVATDYVVFRQGDTFAGAMTIAQSGSALSSIIIGAYGIGAAPIIAPPATSNAVTAANQSYLTIQDLTCTGADTTAVGGAAGILLTASSGTSQNLTVQRCTTSGFGDSGISCNVSSTGHMDALKILNCTSFGNAIGTNSFTCGIWVGGNGVQGTNYYPISNLLIDGCITHDNPGHNGTANWCGSGIKVGSCQNSVVQNCVAYSNGSLCNLALGGPTGIWVSQATTTTIQFCESYLTTGINGDGCGFDMDGGCSSCVCQYNYSHDNDGSGYMDYVFDSASNTGNTNNVIRFNISSNDAKKWNGAIQIASAPGTAIVNSQCYGNTIFTKGVQAVSCIKVYKSGAAGLTATIANNILVSENPNAKLIFTNTTNPSGATFAGNSYYAVSTFAIEWNGTTYGSVAAWQAVTNQEKISGSNVSQSVEPTTYYFGSTATGDPSGARLTTGSALYNTGVNLFSNFAINPGTRDYFGGAVSSAGPYSVGCSWAGSALSLVYLTATGAGVQTIPSDFSSLFSVECIAAGGGNTGNGAAAGGGAFAKITSTTTPLAANSNVNYGVGAAAIGAAGGNTWWNSTSLASAVSLGSAVAVGAQGGQTNVTSTRGIGGAAGSSVGTVVFSGGAGGTTSGAGVNGGGGGAAGPFGAGAAGGAGGNSAGFGAGGGGGGGGGTQPAQPGNSTGGSGGNNWIGLGGAAGSASVVPGAAGNRGGGGAGAVGSGGAEPGGSGGTGIEWDSTHGSGGGSGAAVGSSTPSITGGLYGGGAGGRNGGPGGQGVVRFAYKTAGVV